MPGRFMAFSSKRLVLARIAACVLLIGMLWVGWFLERGTLPMLTKWSAYGLNYPLPNTFAIWLQQEFGFTATDPHWWSSKFYFLLNTFMALLAIYLFYLDKEAVYLALWLLLGLFCLSLVTGTLGRLIGIMDIQAAAYEVIGLISSPFIPFLLIPVFHLLERNNVKRQ